MASKIFQSPQGCAEDLLTQLPPQQIERLLTDLVHQEFGREPGNRQNHAQTHEGRNQWDGRSTIPLERHVDHPEQRCVDQAAGHAGDYAENQGPA